MDWSSKHAGFVLAAYFLSFAVLVLLAARIFKVKRQLDGEHRTNTKQDDAT
jgi:heme exporter protein D